MITKEKMYINMLAEGADGNRFPPAVLEFDKLHRVWTETRKGPLWVKYKALLWQTTDGKTGCFGQSMYRFLNYDKLAELLNSEQWIQCLLC